MPHRMRYPPFGGWHAAALHARVVVLLKFTLIMVHQLKKLLLFAALPALAQNDNVAASHFSSEASNSPPGIIRSQTNQSPGMAQRLENIRLECIQNRRTICGKILQVLPDGLVIDSGYTNIMRDPLNRKWLIPGSVQGRHAANVVEGDQPACVCIGLVFLTDLPKKPKPKVYDYVNLIGYPTGQYTYTSVGDVRRTVRRFSAKLTHLVQRKFDESEKQNQNRQF